MFFTVEMLKPHFELFESCRGVGHDEKHHPEGDVFVHSLQVLHWALRESDDVDLVFAAMLHDVGKRECGKGHEQISVELTRNIASVKTLWLVEHHMRIWHYLLGEMRKLSKCKYLAGHPWLPDLIQLARWDKLGRNPRMKVKYDKERIVEKVNLIAENHFNGPKFDPNIVLNGSRII